MTELQTASPEGRVLVLDANARRAEELSDRLRTLNYDPVTPQPGQDLDALSGDAGVAVMLGDLSSGKGLRRALRDLSKKRPALPVLRMSNSESSSDSDEKPGHRYLWNVDFPLRHSQLAHLLRRAKRYRGREQSVRLTGESRAIRGVRALIEQVSDFDTNVLITGESGTGKELVARMVHDLSERRDGPFVPINCGAIPAELLESELFGHEKGAFTGALTSRKGRFELAEGGTLFLDEIGDMGLPMQAKLLRVLQERCYERVGSNRTRRSDVRIVAATHRDLPAAVREGGFREDLYYRLNVFPIHMPPLRQRIGDLPALLDELLREHAAASQERIRLTEDAMRTLSRYSWPGNIRELRNLVERLAILHSSGEVDLSDLPKRYRNAPASNKDMSHMPAVNTEFSSVDLKDYLQNIERDLIRRALQESDGVVARAARMLNLRRTTLVEKLGRHGL